MARASGRHSSSDFSRTSCAPSSSKRLARLSSGSSARIRMGVVPAQLLTSRNESSSAGLSGRLRLRRMASKVSRRKQSSASASWSTGTILEERQLDHRRFSSISSKASQRTCSSSSESSTINSLRDFESATWVSARRRRFVSEFVRRRLNSELVLLQLPVQGGASNSEQIGGDSAIAFGIRECVEDGLPLHLRQRNDRRADTLRCVAVLMSQGFAGWLWYGLVSHGNRERLSLLRQ